MLVRVSWRSTGIPSAMLAIRRSIRCSLPEQDSRRCDLPAAWDHLRLVLARSMGPPGLPVMGPPAGLLRIKRSGEVGEVVIPGGFSGRGSRGAAGVAVGGGGPAGG